MYGIEVMFLNVLTTKVKLTDHERQRIYERFGNLSDRELSDLVRNARLKGHTTTTMDQDHYEYGLYKRIFRRESGVRMIRLYKDAYFVFVSGNKAAGCKLLVTVILYEPEWRENRRASLRKGQGGVEEDGNSESNT